MISRVRVHQVSQGVKTDHLPDIIRAPNHLGDFVMALPALAAARAADILIARWIAPLAELLPRDGDIIPFDRGRRGIVAAARTLRRRSYRSGVLLPPSFSSALVFSLGGVKRIRGTATDGRHLLVHERIPRSHIAKRHRTDVYVELVTGEAGERDAAGTIVPSLPLPDALRERWRVRLAEMLGRPPLGSHADRPVVGIFPGSNAPSRRWDAPRFAETARGLAALDTQVIVFGGVNETVLTREVAQGVALDLGGRTDLPLLAAALADCDLLITNDSGPMHLAAAVGTRTLVVSGPADTRETGPRGAGHAYLQRLDLPCVPCVRNDCPRSGAGYILPVAERECLRLIDSEEVVGTAQRMLSV